MSLTLKHADNSRLNSSLTLCKVTGFVMKVLNGRSLQSEWERVVNGLRKALFIHAPTQPAPVPVRRRDIATGVFVYMSVYERGKCAYQLCVCVCVCV